MENDVKELPDQFLIAYVRIGSATYALECVEEVVVESIEEC